MGSIKVNFKKIYLIAYFLAFIAMCIPLCIYRVFGIPQMIITFFLVSLILIKYKLIQKCTDKFSWMSLVLSSLLSIYLIIFKRIYPYWNTIESISSTGLYILTAAIETVSLSIFFNPVINLISLKIFDDKSINVEKFIHSLISSASLLFIIFIYLPSDSYINNHSDFNFSYQMFIIYNLIWFVLYSVLFASFITLLRDLCYRIIISLITGLNICVYLQYMFMNKDLGLLDGETMIWSKYIVFSVITALIWSVITGGLIFIALKYWKFFEKIKMKIPVLLTALQTVSLLLMIVISRQEIFNSQIAYMGGEEQYTVSKQKNIIMFILDATDNSYFQELISTNPDAFQGFEDFTMYTNTCSVFDSTPTSMTQMLTGMEFLVELPGKEWYRQAWSAPKAVEFFSRFHNAGYTINGYNIEGLPDDTNTDKFDNYQKHSYNSKNNNIVIDKSGLLNAFTRLSLYRSLPFALKHKVSIENVDFNYNIKIKNNAYYKNKDFDDNLNLITSNTDNNYLVIQHLNGTHPPCEEPIKETVYLLDILRKYINQLKELGVYEESSIIITADHGLHNGVRPEIYATPIFMIKKSNSENKSLSFSEAPIYHEDIQATLLKCADLYNEAGDKERFGRSVFDISENEKRERTWYDRQIDPDFKEVPNMNANFFIFGTENTYYSYTYTGNSETLKEMVYSGNITKKYQMTDNKG